MEVLMDLLAFVILMGVAILPAFFKSSSDGSEEYVEHDDLLDPD